MFNGNLRINPRGSQAVRISVLVAVVAQRQQRKADFELKGSIQHRSLAFQSVAHMIIYVYLFIFYIPWIFWDKLHLDIGIVNIDMNTLYNVMM